MSATTPSTDERLLSSTETAERLGLTREVIVTMARAGDIGHYRVGQGRGVLRFSEAQIADYLAAREVRRKPAA